MVPRRVTALKQAGVSEIVVARLDEGDVSEDEAAASIAAAIAGEGVSVERAFTGRANLFAAEAGVLVVDREAVDRINRVDEAITFATLPAFKAVVAGEMIATVKIIPFGVEAVAAGYGCSSGGCRANACRAVQDQARWCRFRRSCQALHQRWSTKRCASRRSVSRRQERALLPSDASLMMTRRLAPAIEELLKLGAELGAGVRRICNCGPARCHPGGN